MYRMWEMSDTFDDLLFAKKVKLSDLVSPEDSDLEIFGDKCGICIYVPSEKEYNTLMRHLKTLGWYYIKGDGGGYSPTPTLYRPDFKYI